MLSIILYNCIVVYISKNSLWFPPFSLPLFQVLEEMANDI